MKDVPFIFVDTQRATTAMGGARALSADSLRKRANNHVAAANRTSEQPFAKALEALSTDALKQHAANIASDDLILLGIGGSALGAAVIHEALRPNSPWEGRQLHVLDHLDPMVCHATIEQGWRRGAHFCVISKSGDTTETMALATILDRVAGSANRYGDGRVTIVTNEPPRDTKAARPTPVRVWGSNIGATIFDMPVSLGGRYSVLSAVGLAPAALLGYDVDALVSGGREMLKRLTRVDPHRGDGIGHEALELASALVGLDVEHGWGAQVLMPYLHRMGRFGDWFVQLWAESLGKKAEKTGKSAGPAGPIRGVGPTDQHSFAQLLLEGRPDKVVLFLDLIGNSDGGEKLSPSNAFEGTVEGLRGFSLGQILATECFSTELALHQVERPSIAIRTDDFDARVLGGLFVLFEATTFLAAEMYSVNPYDQPGVQEIKAFIKKCLSPQTAVDPERAQVVREWERNGRFPRQVPIE